MAFRSSSCFWRRSGFRRASFSLRRAWASALPVGSQRMIEGRMEVQRSSMWGKYLSLLPWPSRLCAGPVRG